MGQFWINYCLVTLNVSIRITMILVLMHSLALPSDMAKTVAIVEFISLKHPCTEMGKKGM